MAPSKTMFYQIKQLKGKPVAYKADYVFTYFRRTIIGSLILLICIGSLVYHFLNRKESVFNTICINSSTDSQSIGAYSDTISTYLRLDNPKQTVYFYSDIRLSDHATSDYYQNMSRLFTLVATGDADTITGDLDILLQLAYSDYFENLSTILPEKDFNRFAPYFLYIDTALIEASATGNILSSYPDPTDPSQMANPVPVLIQIPPSSSFIDTVYPLNSSDISIGIVVNSPHLQNALHFLDFII